MCQECVTEGDRYILSSPVMCLIFNIHAEVCSVFIIVMFFADSYCGSRHAVQNSSVHTTPPTYGRWERLL